MKVANEDTISNYPNEKPSAIEVSSLTYRHRKAKANALHIAHWRVASGARIFLHGQSGSGKSTLLQLLCGLRVGKGVLSIIGTPINTLSSAKRDRFRSRHIGMVFQQFNLIPYLSAMDNVILAANLAGRGKGAKSRAEYLLGQVGLSNEVCQQSAHTLSIGQQQRVAIARALINSPEVLLFDEPTSALDEANQKRFMALLMEHLDSNPATTLVFVSHDTRLSSYFEQSYSLADMNTANSLEESCSGN